MYNDVDCIIFYIVGKTFLIDLEVKSTSVWGKCTPGYLFSLRIWYKVTESWEKQLYGKAMGVYWKLVERIKNIEK